MCSLAFLQVQEKSLGECQAVNEELRKTVEELKRQVRLIT
jgi:hypothetical protein